MNIRFLYFIFLTIVEVAKSSTEADDGSVLTKRLFESKHILRGSGSNDEKETGKNDETSSVKHRTKRMLEVGTKKLLQLMSINDDCDSDDEEEGDESNEYDEMSIEPSTSPSFLPTVTRSNPPSISTEPSPSPSFLPTVTLSNPPSISTEPSPSFSFIPTVTHSNPPSISKEPSPSPSFLPTVTRSNPPSMYLSMHPSARYEVEKLVASDGKTSDYFGSSCSISDDLVLIGSPWVDGENIDEGAVYLFHLDGTEVAKLTPGDDGKRFYYFGLSISMDKKIVVGSGAGYIHVFSNDGIWERTLKACEGCYVFGERVTTLENLIVTFGEKNSIKKLLVYSTEGQLLKTIDQGSDYLQITHVAISEQYIVLTGLPKTVIYANEAPDFNKIAEINQGGRTVAVSNDRIVIGDYRANDDDGAAWLYETNGTLVKTLDRQDALSESEFGDSVAITDDKVFIGARWDDVEGTVFIYSADTGEFLEKVLAPDGNAYDYFGRSVCASDSYFVVGASGVDFHNTGAAYLFQLLGE